MKTGRSISIVSARHCIDESPLSKLNRNVVNSRNHVSLTRPLTVVDYLPTVVVPFTVVNITLRRTTPHGNSMAEASTLGAPHKRAGCAKATRRTHALHSCVPPPGTTYTGSISQVSRRKCYSTAPEPFDVRTNRPQHESRKDNPVLRDEPLIALSARYHPTSNCQPNLKQFYAR
ncbi:hypothetical protein GOBAR_DD35639 [Gossypium barbadense]|nr:hypothetical protein GOBAR_DD35639 [Gossypium barbadense]